MPSRKRSSWVGTIELFMPGVLCPTFSARQKKFRVGTIELFMSGVLCRAFSAEQKKSECGHNAAFLQNFFYAEQKVGDQNILNAGIKSQRFLCPAFSAGLLESIVPSIKHKKLSFLCRAFSPGGSIVPSFGIKQKTPSFLCWAFYAERFDCARGINGLWSRTSAYLIFSNAV